MEGWNDLKHIILLDASEEVGGLTAVIGKLAD